jgi:hypothetical protein
MTPGNETQRPAPMPYHCAMVKHLQTTEPGLWSWFSSTRKRLEEADAVRLDLLKSTYRLEPQAQPKLYDLATSVRERIGLTCSVTIYQAQTGNALNAALAYLPGEAHVILAGPLADVLAESELCAVLVRLGRIGQQGKNKIAILIRQRPPMFLSERQPILRHNGCLADAQFVVADLFQLAN